MINALRMAVVVAALYGAAAPQAFASPRERPAAQGEAPPDKAPQSAHNQSAHNQSAHDRMEAIRSYSAEKSGEAVKKAREALDDFDARMKVLEQQIKEKKASWSATFAREKEEELVALRQVREEEGRRYEKLRHASKKLWRTTRDAFVSSYRKLEHEFDALKASISDKDNKTGDAGAQHDSKKDSADE